jgi:hypothetical protein
MEPFPIQIDLFGTGSSEELPENPHVSFSNEPVEDRSRDPTSDLAPGDQGPGSRGIVKLNEAQLKMASDLYRKSRELALKNHKASIQEERRT